uniref:Uncharacterized protein n=1 Tax=Anguilla anguilla TaxID=7936 RepID=A0A0E9QGT3_ANGAN
MPYLCMEALATFLHSVLLPQCS